MRINKINMKPVEDSINPEILFEIELLYQGNIEFPIEVFGYLNSKEGKKMANICETIHNHNTSFQLDAKGRYNQNEKPLLIKAIAPLKRQTLDYIETLRAKHPKGNIEISIELIIKTLVSKTCLSNMSLIDYNKLGLNPPTSHKNAKAVLYEYNNRFSTSQTNMWILSGDGGESFLEIKYSYFTENKTIHSSVWIHDYCPIFQLGRFMVVDLLLPDYTEGSEDLDERANASIQALRKMEKKLLDGEWSEVIEKSRPIHELLRNESEIIDLLQRSGYTEQAIIAFNNSLQQLFDFSSKFVHREDRGKKIMPEVIASKEDAYMIYALSMTIINLITKKKQRLST